MRKVLFALIITITVLLNINPVYADVIAERALNGFSYYICDEELVVEWNDPSATYIEVSATDTSTTEIFFRKTVKECPVRIPLDYRSEIILTVNAKGYESIQALVPTVYHSDASVSCETPNITNQMEAHMVIDLNGNYKIVAYNGSEQSVETGWLQPGEYDIYIPLITGTNSLIVYIIDQDGNRTSFKENVVLDTTPPSLSLAKEYDSMRTYSNMCTLSGIITDYESFTINNIPVAVEKNGNFTFDYSLIQGDNYIAIEAQDKAGNVVNYYAVVTRLVKAKNKKIDAMTIVVIVVAILFVVTWILKKKGIIDKLKNRSKEENKEEENEPNEEVVQIEQPKPDDDRIKKFRLLRSILAFAVPFLIVFFLMKFCIFVASVKSGSMEPTISTGGVVLANRLAYVGHNPQRGDVITFYSREEKKIMLKRVIGIAGDNISFIDGDVFINGKICVEDYLVEDTETNADYDFLVPEGCVFVLGDNRENSLDSRYWNNPYISIKDIYGRVFFHF